MSGVKRECVSTQSKGPTSQRNRVLNMQRACGAISRSLGIAGKSGVCVSGGGW